MEQQEGDFMQGWRDFWIGTLCCIISIIIIIIAGITLVTVL